MTDTVLSAAVIAYVGVPGRLDAGQSQPVATGDRARRSADEELVQQPVADVTQPKPDALTQGKVGAPTSGSWWASVDQGCDAARKHAIIGDC